jgi:class 3 adenylate cyclase/tetratricopeptide (TPR) repeat protein
MAVTCSACTYQNADDARFCAGCGATLGTTCAACGTLVPPGGRFCPSCGTPLQDAGPAEAPVEERRVVSILFADLAGFTSRSDHADPEDVRRTLMPFHAIAKEEIERFGGALDKFIGDAAMGVFGAPVAHEDDAERAIRAALAIQARTSEMDIPVRAAVNTGEAVVTFGTGPQVGENVAGDVVNTASRLQSVAPHGGVAVGESTYRTTRGAVDYRELEPVTVKGKAEPLRVWVVEGVREEAPGRADDEATPFVGRERERSLLRELFARAIRERSLQLVTIVGDPGIGKTRLVGDLRDHVLAHEEATTWYRGRCLPYGESVTFAPLEEVVREATGVRRSDAREEAAGKLDRHLRALEPRAEDTDWLRARLAPLLGLVDVEGQAAVAREESFAAWTRFLGDEAALAPTVLVIEDLHWADPAMLDFLDQLGDHLPDAPLLLVATARPELFDSRRDWGAGKPNSSTVTLSPLTEDDMQRLLAELLVRTVLPPEAQAPLVASAGGNPLYALEFVRMLADQGAVADASSIALPETIHGLIAARLDALTSAQRSLLQDAAVVGDPFWSGAVASMHGGEDVTASLAELRRRGLIRRTSSQTMTPEDEYAFTHGLIRDVAYGRIPRAGRATRHLAVARWLEETAGDRLEDRAELLAHHTTQALTLSIAAGVPDDVTALTQDARRFLLLAGQRQMPIDVPQAATYLRRAMELTPVGDPQRPTLLRRGTELAWRAGKVDVDEAIRAYREAMDEALANGDEHEAAFCMRRLYFQLGFRGDTEAARKLLDRGIDMLERREGETPELLAELYACRAEDEMFSGRTKGSLEWADRALALPHSASVDMMALHIRGNGRCELGDLDGMDDLWDALHRAEASGNGVDLAQSYSYLSEWVGLQEGPMRSLEMNRAQVEACEVRGMAGQTMWSTAESLWMLYDAGRWDEALVRAARAIEWATQQEDSQVGTVALTYSARILAHRGQVDEAAALVERYLHTARQIGDLQVTSPALVTAAVVASMNGDAPTAVGHLREFDDATQDGPTEYRELQLPEAIRICRTLGDLELAEALAGTRPVFVTRTRNSMMSVRALLAEMRGDHEDAAARSEEAADAWSGWDDPFERAHALDGMARCLSAIGVTEDAASAKSEARAIFSSLGIPDTSNVS